MESRHCSNFPGKPERIAPWAGCFVRHSCSRTERNYHVPTYECVRPNRVLSSFLKNAPTAGCPGLSNQLCSHLQGSKALTEVGSTARPGTERNQKKPLSGPIEGHPKQFTVRHGAIQNRRFSWNLIQRLLACCQIPLRIAVT